MLILGLLELLLVDPGDVVRNVDVTYLTLRGQLLVGGKGPVLVLFLEHVGLQNR